MDHNVFHYRHVTPALVNFLLDNKVPNQAYNIITSERKFDEILSYHTELICALKMVAEKKVRFYVGISGLDDILDESCDVLKRSPFPFIQNNCGMHLTKLSAERLKGGVETIVAYCSLSKREIEELEQFLITQFLAQTPEYLINASATTVSRRINDVNKGHTVYRLYFTFFHGISDGIERGLITQNFISRTDDPDYERVNTMKKKAESIKRKEDEWQTNYKLLSKCVSKYKYENKRVSTQSMFETIFNDNPSLDFWNNNQRVTFAGRAVTNKGHYRLLKELHLFDYTSPELVKLLYQFDVNIGGRQYSKNRDYSHNKEKKEQWMENYQRLVDFKQHNNESTRVTHTNTEDRRLLHWVQTQRKIYKSGKILNYRENLLNSIDFEWKIGLGNNPNILWKIGRENNPNR